MRRGGASPRRGGLAPAAALAVLILALASTAATAQSTSSSSSTTLPPLPNRRDWQAPAYTPPYNKRNPLSFLRFFFGPFLQNLHVTGPDSLLPTKVSKAGAALREAGLAPRVAGGIAGPAVVGASQTYNDFISGFVAWIQANVPSYPQPPPQLRSGQLMPPLLPKYEDDLAYVRSLTRGAFPEVIRGRPEALSPRATDPLQNGRQAALQPGFAFTAPGNQERGVAWRQWEVLEAAKRKKRGLARLVGLEIKEEEEEAQRSGGAAAAKTTTTPTTATSNNDDDNDKGAPWLRALIARFDDPSDEL